MALPAAQMIKFMAMATDFFVCPATFREIMEREIVWAVQKDMVM